MRLKSIHIHGFKSFADRTTIHYAEGITGVIGPNGSGKSNVIDAVRWVMGEQTAKSLRADDPTDIIFAGSDNRKPQSMAEVTLTFVNDGTRCPPELLHLPEISIGRRIYKSGEREYLMNGEDCRLKDIVDFLLAIGLGSKSYSIIQQERRDRIIQAGPSDMREILEETAGITIFKTRRKEAEKSLERARTSLNSVAEKEVELNTRSDKLKEQVIKAQQKTDLLTEMREKEILVIGRRATTCKEEMSKLQAEIDAKQKETTQGETQTNEWETQITDLTSERLELLAQISSETSTFDEKRLTKTKYQTKIEGFEDQEQEKKRRKLQLQDDLVREKEALSHDELNLTKLADDLGRLEKEQGGLSVVLAELQEQLEEHDEGIQVESGRGQEIQSELRATKDAANRLRFESESLLKELERNNTSATRLLEEKSALEQDAQNLQADRAHLEGQIRALSGGMEGFAVEKSRLDGSLAALDAEANEARARRDLAKENQINATSHVQSLTKILGQGSGLSSGTKALREHLSQYVGGFVFEKFTAHREDESTLEVAIPDLLESAVITGSEQMMEFLDKAEESGVSRVSFLVGELIPEWSNDEQLAFDKLCTHQGVRNVAARATHLENGKVKHFLQRVWIVRDEWMGLKLQREAQALGVHTFLFVSERGTVLGTGPREITYGPKEGGEGQGLLARKRELEEWQLKLEESQGVLAASEGVLFELQSKRRQIETRLGEVILQLSKEKEEVLKLGSSLQGLDFQWKSKSDTLAKLVVQLNELLKEQNESKLVYQTKSDQIQRLEEEEKQLSRQYLDFEESYSDKKQVRDEVMSQVLGRKNDAAVHSATLTLTRQNYEQTANHFKRSSDKVQRVLEELAQPPERCAH